MKLSDLTMLSVRSFKTKPGRTFLTVLGVSVGIGAVLFLVSLGYGLQNIILTKITSADALLSLDVSPGSAGLIGINNDTVEKISKISEVAEVSPAANLTAQITLGELTGDGMVYAANNSFFRLGGISPAFGNIFSSDNSRDAVISTAGAKLLNIDPPQIIGKEIDIILFLPKTKTNDDAEEEIEMVKLGEKYKITGVIEDENANFIFIPLKSLENLDINNYNQLKVKAASEEVVEEARNKIIEQGFLVSSLSDTINQAKKIFKVIQIILALFGLVALVVSAIGMVNTMTITLLERTNEIGIMRSIGASQSDIRKLFLIESLLMGLAGGLGGVLIGYLGSEMANFGLNLLAKNFGGESLDLFYMPAWFIGIIIASSSLVGFITGLYPSHRAAKINPLDALKYK